MSLTAGLIADDLTGASDAAVQFARRGWQTLLVLGSDPLQKIVRGSDPSLMALSSDSRAMSHEAAEQATARAVVTLLDAGVDRLYLKIDSTMRGSVPGQIAGALSAWRTIEPGAFAAVCPAYPDMGRTVAANHLLVDGGPVELSPIGRDPVTPVRTGDLAVLIPGSVKKGYGPFSRDEKGPYPFFTMTFDATSDEHLTALGSAIAATGRSAIPVGSGGLAKAMAVAWSGGPAAFDYAQARKAGHYVLPAHPRILIQMTSLNPVSLAQVARLSAVFPDVLVLTGKAEDVSAVLEDHAKTGKWDVLGLIGGDGARAAVARLGASAIRIVDAVIEGVPLGIIAGGHADGTPVFTKAGGFGAEDALVRVVEKIMLSGAGGPRD